MRNFCGYQRKAIIVIPKSEEYNRRLSTHNAIEGKASESNLTEMKGTYILTLHLHTIHMTVFRVDYSSNDVYNLNV